MSTKPFELDISKARTSRDADDQSRKRIRERELNDLRKVLAVTEGRRVIWRLMAEAGIFRSSFTGNSETFFNEGKRSIGLFVLDELMQAKPDAFALMQKEAASAKPTKGNEP